MELVSFINIEESDKDLILSFALDDGDGYIRSLLLHRTLFYEFIMPEEEQGTKVSLEGQNLTEEHLNTLEHITLEGTILKIKARFSSHEVDLRKLEPKEINQVKDSIVRQNFDNRFGVKFTSPTD